MTSPNPMTREQLIELAALDVFGLLDEYDAALYTRSFHHAPVAVQDEILQVQADIASANHLLPDDAPAAELRQRVLEAVARAVEQENAALGPIASIGGRHQVAGEAVRSGARPSVAQVLFGGSGHFWRAAAFVLAGAVIVLAYFWAESNRDSKRIAAHAERIAEIALNSLTDANLKTLIGPDLEDFLSPVRNPTGMQRTLRPQIEGYEGTAVVLYHREDTDQAFLLTVGLPESDEPYQLRVRHADDTVEVVDVVESRPVGGLRLEQIPRGLFASAAWELVDAKGAVVLSTA